jgi:hypothetical protein
MLFVSSMPTPGRGHGAPAVGYKSGGYYDRSSIAYNGATGSRVARLRRTFLA